MDLAQPALDPRNFAGKGVEGGVAWGVVGGTAAVEAAVPPPELPGGQAVYLATLEDVRFEPARLVSLPTPRYPRTMELLGLSGRVVMQFIIDTVGRVEYRSMQVLQSTHRDFEEVARESVSGGVPAGAHRGGAGPAAHHPAHQLHRHPLGGTPPARRTSPRGTAPVTRLRGAPMLTHGMSVARKKP